MVLIPDVFGKTMVVLLPLLCVVNNHQKILFMKYIKSLSFYNIKIIYLAIAILLCGSCNTTEKEHMDHFLTGKIIFIDSTNKDFSFIMQPDSLDKQVAIIPSKKLVPDLVNKKLRKGLRIKIKGDRVKYIRYGKEKSDAANVLIIDQLEIIK